MTSLVVLDVASCSDVALAFVMAVGGEQTVLECPENIFLRGGELCPAKTRPYTQDP